jgi:hypothetical protein
MALSSSKLLQLKDGTLAHSFAVKSLIKTRLNVFSVAEFQPQLLKISALVKSRPLSGNELHYIRQWKKFDKELTDANYLALLQLYSKDRSTTKVVEVVDSMAIRGFKIPPPHFYQLILIGISWKRIIAIRDKCTTKESKLIIDKMVIKYLNNLYDQMEEGHYDKQPLRVAMEQMKKSQYYFQTLHSGGRSKPLSERKKRPKWHKNLKNYILLMIAINKQMLSASQVKKALFHTFQIEPSTRAVEKELDCGPFTKSVLDPKKWGIGKETHSVPNIKFQNNNVVQRHIEKFTKDLLLKCSRLTIEELVDRIKLQWNSQRTLE